MSPTSTQIPERSVRRRASCGWRAFTPLVNLTDPTSDIADAEGENALKIILLGDSAVGKSKLVERFLVRAAYIV